MKFLVTGVNGQLGYDVKEELLKRGYTDICSPTRDELDITNESDVLTYQYTFICGEYSNIITEKEKAALLLHNGDISQGYCPIWIEKNESGLYTVSDRSKVQYTTEVISPEGKVRRANSYILSFKE